MLRVAHKDGAEGDGFGGEIRKQGENLPVFAARALDDDGEKRKASRAADKQNGDDGDRKRGDSGRSQHEGDGGEQNAAGESDHRVMNIDIERRVANMQKPPQQPAQKNGEPRKQGVKKDGRFAHRSLIEKSACSNSARYYAIAAMTDSPKSELEITVR